MCSARHKTPTRNSYAKSYSLKVYVNFFYCTRANQGDGEDEGVSGGGRGRWDEVQVKGYGDKCPSSCLTHCKLLFLLNIDTKFGRFGNFI